MNHSVVSGAVAIVALIAAVIVQVASSEDPTPYLGVATAAAAYAAGNAVGTTKTKR